MKLWGYRSRELWPPLGLRDSGEEEFPELERSHLRETVSLGRGSRLGKPKVWK